MYLIVRKLKGYCHTANKTTPCYTLVALISIERLRQLVVVRRQTLDGRLEAALLRHDVLHHPGVAVGLQDGVAALCNVAVAMLPGVLHVPGVLVMHAVLVCVVGLGL